MCDEQVRFAKGIHGWFSSLRRSIRVNPYGFNNGEIVTNSLENVSQLEQNYTGPFERYTFKAFRI